MENELLKQFIEECNLQINQNGENNPLLYEVCFFKVYVKFEHFLSDIFEMYAGGQCNSNGFCPKRKLEFESIEHFNALMRDNEKRYNYVDRIQRLSKHIFIDNPFDIIYDDTVNNDLFNKMISLRNHIAHESCESRRKYIKCCLSNGRYIEPYEFLKKQHRNQHKSYYTIFTQTISNVSDYLLNNSSV